jgi:hypothetical protein
MEYRTTLVCDEKNGRFKTAAYTGLVLLGVAFGYSWGMQNTLGVGDPSMANPVNLEGLESLRAAADQARAKGDESGAKWYESAMASHREHLLTMMTARQMRTSARSAWLQGG